MFKMKREKCGLCGSKLGKNSGIMQYRATDNDGLHEMFSMAICSPCADDLDSKQTTQLETQDVRDWLLRKVDHES